jgi:hypothetical protein
LLNGYPAWSTDDDAMTGIEHSPQPLAASLPEISPGIRAGQDAFRRELPALLADPRDRGLCVAYANGVRFGIHRDARILNQQAADAGIADGDLYIDVIEPGAGPDSESFSLTRPLS